MPTLARRYLPLAAVIVTAVLTACADATGSGESRPCTTSTQCPTGQACRSGYCAVVPCGGRCGAEEVCLGQTCEPVDGLDCASDATLCPKGFRCSDGGVCARLCTDDKECTNRTYPSCNTDVGHCGQCTFDKDCTADPERRFCDPASALCVGCADDADCRASNGAPVGQYCDPTSRTCKTGCHASTECPTGQQCLGGSATVVGRCIECRPESEAADCNTDPQRKRCEPRTNLCVQCLDANDCDYQCNVEKGRCVRCVQNEVCDRGYVCDQEINDCLPGCARGNGGTNCPSDKPACDAAFGDHGRCVECLVDADCPRAKLCDLSGTLPKCVPGCTNASGAADDSRCIDLAGTTPPPVDVLCDVARNAPRGLCVQCRKDVATDCPTSLVCDDTSGRCRCKTFDEPCNTVDECGYIPSTGQCAPYSASSARTCINAVECDSASTFATPLAVAGAAGKCSTNADYQGKCPSNLKLRYVIDLQGNRRLGCVPRGVCGQ
jgi:hypothetical protein